MYVRDGKIHFKAEGDVVGWSSNPDLLCKLLGQGYLIHYKMPNGSIKKVPVSGTFLRSNMPYG